MTTSYSRVKAPTSKEILRYRYQHGVNLGGIFVLERWLSGHMFDASAGGGSELDAVVSSIRVRGLEETKRKWEEHWSSAITDEELGWLADVARCNHVRIPVGYFTLGPEFCGRTPFAGRVYVDAWKMVKEVVGRCWGFGLGVLIDLHALPGGANADEHSGTSSGKAELWEDHKKNLELAERCLLFIAREVACCEELEGVVGIELCNEAVWDAPGMYDWYGEIIQKISAVDDSIHVYLSDGWDFRRALCFGRAYNTVHGPSACPVVIDRHQYYAFDSKDTRRSPEELIEQARNDLRELDDSLVGNIFDHQAAVAAYIGEYSAAMAGQTWARVSPDQKPDLMKRFGNIQSDRWQEKSSGSSFWTFKMDSMDGCEWDFQQQVKDGGILPPKSLTLTFSEVQDKLRIAEKFHNNEMREAMQQHCDYWSRSAPGVRFEHWRFAEGWHLGWTDAQHFFAARIKNLIPSNGKVLGMNGHDAGGLCCERADADDSSRSDVGEDRANAPGGADKIGLLDLWTLKRMKEVGVAARETCEFGWEWEHGFRAGIKRFYQIIEV